MQLTCRAAVFVSPDGAALFSRQGKDLSRYFPELIQAAASQIPPGCVLDGEAVIWAGERLDFDALQKRLVTGVKALPALARERPASFVAFDLLAVPGHDIRETPLAGRRELLEHLAADWVPPLNLSPATRDRELALQWFEEMPAVGVEGLMVKAAGQSYQPGVRQWWKVKRRETVDVVCAAVIGPMARPEYVVAGLPVKGRLRIVGRSSALTAVAARALAAQLREPIGPHPWPEVITETTLNRFSKDKGPVHLTRVEPIVVEVSADVAWSGNAFRNALRYVRPRPELDPGDVEPPAR